MKNADLEELQREILAARKRTDGGRGHVPLVVRHRVIKHVAERRAAGEPKHYLRFLVEQVVVHDDAIEIVGKTRETAALLASAASGTRSGAGTLLDSATTGGVLTSVGGWLPSPGSSKNFRVRLGVVSESEKRRAERKARLAEPEARRQVVDQLARADEFRRLLGTGEVKNRAELARRFGISRARVTQILGKPGQG